MTKTPFLNAFLAALYIVVIVLIMDTITSVAMPKETIVVPMAVLSLFVLSAAVMGFLFLYEPFSLYFEDKKPEALSFFLKTLGTFACFVALFLVILLYAPSL
ncbi:MAG TPA: hypothetical protein VGA06_00690 [Candidatus Paceibacterota bacterium]